MQTEARQGAVLVLQEDHPKVGAMIIKKYGVMEVTTEDDYITRLPHSVRNLRDRVGPKTSGINGSPASFMQKHVRARFWYYKRAAKEKEDG